MRILLTGASSFTGMWFAETLAKLGHEVTAPIRKPLAHYQDLRKQRIDRIASTCTLIEDCSYGSESFLQLIKDQPFDLFCHHAADVTDYKSPLFNPVAALANNTGPIRPILESLLNKGCSRIVLTGSVFEPGEGLGQGNDQAVSPYGLSKGLTSALFHYYCAQYPIHLGKFVIPNPFGPFEEFRFTSFLIREWKEKKEAFVSMPAYIRDNIPASLLANAYADFAEHLPQTPGFTRTNPSFYKGSQGEFTKKFAEAMRPRLQLDCAFKLADQTVFQEPKERVNFDRLDPHKLKWNEEAAWDQLASYYAT